MTGPAALGDEPCALPDLARRPRTGDGVFAGGDAAPGRESVSKLISGSSAWVDAWLLSGLEGFTSVEEVDLVLLDRAGGVVFRVRADLVLLGRLEGTIIWKAVGPELPDPTEGFAPRLGRAVGGLGLLEGLVLVSGVNLTLFRDCEERGAGPAGLGSGLGAGLR